MNSDFKWIETGETIFELRDEDKLLATLSLNESNYLWYLEFEYGFTNTLFVNDESIEYIKFQAIQYIIDCCDTKIDDYTRIKERL